MSSFFGGGGGGGCTTFTGECATFFTADATGTPPFNYSTLTAGCGTFLSRNVGTHVATVGACGTYVMVDMTGDPPTNSQVLTAGSNITLTPNAANHALTIAATGGSAASPDQSVQFASGTSFAGCSAFIFDTTCNALQLTGCAVLSAMNVANMAVRDPTQLGAVWNDCGTLTVSDGTVNGPQMERDPGFVTIRDDFTGGNTASSGIGNYNWVLRSIGAAPTAAYLAGATPNFGQLQIQTTTTLSQGGGITLDSSGVGPLGNLAALGNWDATWIFQTGNSLAGNRFRIGLGFNSGGMTTVQPTDGFWLRFDKENGFQDCLFYFETREASLCSQMSTGWAPSASAWYKLRIRQDCGNRVLFTLSDGQGCGVFVTEKVFTKATSGGDTVRARITTQALAPMALMVTNTAGTLRSFVVDFFSYATQRVNR
jgi:hypothetical protein